MIYAKEVEYMILFLSDCIANRQINTIFDVFV